MSLKKISMNKKFTPIQVFALLALFFCWLGYAPLANAQDTLVVPIFTYDDPSPQGWSAPYRGSFNMPAGNETYEKILMKYSLKCDPATAHDEFDCGQWDYLSYTYITNYAGEMDSVYLSQSMITVNGEDVAQLSYTNDTTFSTIEEVQQSINHTETLSMNMVNIGEADDIDAFTLGSTQKTGRSQFLWTAAELLDAGLVAGDITDLQLNRNDIAHDLKKLTIRVKATPLNELTANTFQTEGLLEVYRWDTEFVPETGWHTFNFLTPFNWDGTSNIVVDFSYTNETNSSSPNPIAATDVGFNAGVNSLADLEYLDFNGGDHVNIPVDAISQLDEEVTLSFWQYGDPDFLPQDSYHFEGRDANGNRVLNVHLPWSNGRIYWDAGNSGTSNYDRIDKQADLAAYAGVWSHWAFVKNASTGSMKIYLNGAEWYSESGKYLTMSNIAEFRIGDGINNNFSDNFDGYMREFRIWNKALDELTIREWMNQDVNNTHPDYDHLIGYYKLGDSEGTVAIDKSVNALHGALVGLPVNGIVAGTDINSNMQTTSLRPQIIFQQGTYVSEVNTQISVSQIPNDVIFVSLYENEGTGAIIADDAPNLPSNATDQFYAWPAEIYTYTYNTDGEILDSTLIAAQANIEGTIHEYYSPTVTYEIARYITPYGINLVLGPNNEGVTWTYDVTDYAPILRDSVFISAGNNQELLNLEFLFIKGTPPRNVLGIKNLWGGSFSYNSFLDDTQGEPITIELPQSASNFRIKTRTTGHGFGTNSENCAEFCPKTHSLNVDGAQQFAWELWDECATNPVYPQGGTWVYDRAGWCPGAAVHTYDHELTPHVSPGSEVTLDYAIQGSAAPAGNWVLQSQLITYGSPNFILDAAIDEVLAPSNDFLKSRYNPICDQPIIRIKNTGATDLTSVLISYGVTDDFGWGTFPCYYRWEGNLAFMESEEITLPLFNWTNLNTDNPRFFVEVSEPNFGQDQYAQNNYQLSAFELPPKYEPGTIFEFRTDNQGAQSAYTVKNDAGEIVLQGNGFSSNTNYQVALDLPNGCYVLEFTDSGIQDGLWWWANDNAGAQPAPSLWPKIRLPDGSIAQTFDPDFGANIKHTFTVGYTLGEEYNGIACTNTTDIEPATNQELANLVKVYPNPTKGKVFIDLNLTSNNNATSKKAKINIYNTIGELVYETSVAQTTQTVKTILPKVAGLYYVQVVTDARSFSKSVLLVE